MSTKTEVPETTSIDEDIDRTRKEINLRPTFFREFKIALTEQNMRKYGFSLTRMLLYDDRIYDPVFIRENTSQ